MTIRSLAIAVVILGLAIQVHDAFGQSTKHPIGNRPTSPAATAKKNRVWQIEYDENAPRTFDPADSANKTFAVRLAIRPFDNVANSLGRVDVIDPDGTVPTLYLFKGVNTTTNKYTAPVFLQLYGTCSLAELRTSGSHWTKKHIDLDLHGTYSKAGTPPIPMVVRVRGSFHPGLHNKEGNGEGPRRDLRLVLNIFEHPQGDLASRFKEMEKYDSCKERALELKKLYKELRKGLAASDDCEDIEPGDAAMEAQIDMNASNETDPTVFAYAPMLP